MTPVHFFRSPYSVERRVKGKGYEWRRAWIELSLSGNEIHPAVTTSEAKKSARNRVMRPVFHKTKSEASFAIMNAKHV